MESVRMGMIFYNRMYMLMPDFVTIRVMRSSSTATEDGLLLQGQTKGFRTAAQVC